MSPKARFALLAPLVAVALFATLRYVMPLVPFSWWLGTTLVAISVLLAAQGVTWRRRLTFAGGTAALMVVLLVVATASRVFDAAKVAATAGTVDASNLELAAYVVIEVIFIGLPLAILALFVGRRPSVLWSEPRDALKGRHAKPAGGTSSRPG